MEVMWFSVDCNHMVVGFMELTAGVAENRDLAAGSIIYDW